MLGRDNYHISGAKELKKSEWQALSFLYKPLIFNDALIVYSYFLNRYKADGVISELLIDLNMSLDTFTIACEKLNEYLLLDTYKHDREDRYIFILNNPRNAEKFLNDEIFSRILLNTIGTQRYNELHLALAFQKPDLKNYHSESKRLKYNALMNWTSEKELDFHFINKQKNVKVKKIDSYFDVERFIKEASPTLLPYKFRTDEIMSMIGRYADLYNISQDQMRVIISKVVAYDLNEFNTSRFKRLCSQVKANYREIKDGEYQVPCSLFLMNLQGGKEPSPLDMELFSELMDKYHLNVEVINYLIEYTLKKCNNRLIRNFIISIASDLHRNDIKTADDARLFLDNGNAKQLVKQSKDVLPNYDDSNNPKHTQEEYEDLLRMLKGENNA